MNREQWREKMCAHIKFRPDHHAIWTEMENHIEDKRAALVASGMKVQEAEPLAVAAMGDPAEVGRQMNTIHKPLLGWLWKASGWLLVLAVVLTVYVLFARTTERETTPELAYYEAYLDENAYRFWYTQLAGKDCVLRAAGPGTEDSWKRYTFQMQDAAVWDDRGNVTLYGHLSVSGFLPGEGALDLDRVYAVDDRGNYYASSWENWNREDLMNSLPSPQFTESHREGLAWEYVVEINDFDPEAQWVEFRCDWDGQDIAFRLEFTGGEDR